MTANEYQARALTFRNPDNAPEDALLIGVMGLCGEAGEAIDHVKKVRFHGHALDKAYLMKELGDIAWYLAEASHALGYSLEEVLQANLEKLSRRYPDGFTSERSQNRSE